MTVKQLIAGLKKMPQDLEVGFAHGDNSEFELAGYAERICLERKEDFDPDLDPSADADMIMAQPDMWVSIRG